jgi:hypothetical protein
MENLISLLQPSNSGPTNPGAAKPPGIEELLNAS